MIFLFAPKCFFFTAPLICIPYMKIVFSVKQKIVLHPKEVSGVAMEDSEVGLTN